jgi:LytS/YehU family sensor histidine kinase
LYRAAKDNKKKDVKMGQRVSKIVSQADKLVQGVEEIRMVQKNIDLKYLTMDIINKHFIFNVIYREDWLRADLLL